MMESLSFAHIGMAVALVIALVPTLWITKKLLIGDPPWATKKEVETVHKRVSDLRNYVDDERHKYYENVESKMSEMNSRIDEIPERIINILSNTGAIKKGK